MDNAMWILVFVGLLMIAAPLFLLHKPNNTRYEFYFTKGAYVAIWGGIGLLFAITLSLIAHKILIVLKN